MRKVTRKSLDELAKVMPIISEERQKMYIGGTSGCSGDIPPGPSGTDGPRPLPPLPSSGPLGSVYNPYTIDDALGLMDAGHWRGGYVTGWGYVSPEVEINAPSGYQPPTGAGGGDGPSGGYDGGSGNGFGNGPSGGYNGDYNYGYDGGPSGGYDGNGYNGDYGYGNSGGSGNGNGGSFGGGYDGGGGYNGGSVGGGSVGGGGGGSASGGSTVGGGGSVTDGGSGGDNSPYVPGNTGSCLGDTYPNGGYGGDNSGALTDGVDIYNTTNFTFKTQSQTVFNEQLTAILRSNSVLKSLLSYFDKGVVHMTFDIQDVDSIAQTTYPSKESFHITFSSQYIDENGWNKILARDNIGYDWSKVQTHEEALVIVLAHEAQHANHVARFFDALKQAEYHAGSAVRLLQNWGYSQEYIEIFFQCENGRWGYNSGVDQVNKMHDYMRKYNYGVLDKALEEYRSDFKY